MDDQTPTKKPRKKRMLSKSLSAIKKREEAKRNKIIKSKPKPKKKKPYEYRGQYLPYERAKKVVKVLTLSSRFAYADWYEKYKPDYLPKRPDRAYKKEFEGWVAFLGKTLARTNQNLKKIRYYKKLQEEKIKNQERETKNLKKQVSAYVKYEMHQAEIQVNRLKRMEKTAAGNHKKVEKKIQKRIAKPIKYPIGHNPNKLDPSKYMDYESAKRIVHFEKLQTFKEYQMWWELNKPSGLPRNPYKIYNDFNVYDFLGTQKKELFIPVDHRAKYRIYEDAVKYVRTLGISTKKEWFDYSKTDKFPKDIPRFPNYTYRYMPKDPTWGKWISWDDWLGKDINLRIEAFREQERVLLVTVPKGVPSNVFSFVYKSGTQTEIDNFIDDNELYVIRIYKIETYDWVGYLSKRFNTYMGETNVFMIPNIHEVLFDLDDYMTRIL
jgi:hypothetical protein